jgi:histidine ammonia-lyase
MTGQPPARRFASPAGRQSLRAARAFRLVVGCELVAAVRALRRRGMRPDPALPVGRAFELAGTVLKDDHADRPLTDDVAQAAEMLDSFARLA